MANSSNGRGLRFSMKALLLLMTVVCGASWVYWDGWEKWLRYREQQAFLSEASQLKPGEFISRQWRPTFTSQPPPVVREQGSYNSKGKYTLYVSCRWPNALYVVFLRYEGSYASSVEIFWLPQAPKQYAAQTERSRFELSRRAEILTNPSLAKVWRDRDDSSQLAYRLDFLEMISGDRSDDMGFEYQLIYADPAVD